MTWMGSDCMAGEIATAPRAAQHCAGGRYGATSPCGGRLSFGQRAEGDWALEELELPYEHETLGGRLRRSERPRLSAR